MIYDVIIVGGGVAGLTAALYTRRSGKSVLILEEETIGGQAALSPCLENLPSIQSIRGSEFTDKLFEQVLEWGAEIELEKVEMIEKTEDGNFLVRTNYSTHTSQTVILANGLKHKHLNLPNEEDMIGHGVSYCAVCDGAFYKDQEVALVGDANTALQYALLLSNICPKVYLFTLFDRFFGEDVLIEAVHNKPNIEVIPNVAVYDYEKDDNGEISKVLYKDFNVSEPEKYEKDVKAIFIAIGQIADNKRFENLVEIDKEGFILTNEDMSTKTPGIYAAGDCRQKTIRQVTTACADGTMAAIAANTYIEKKGL